MDGEAHFLVDANVARLYHADLRAVLDHPNTIRIEATEENKSLERTIPVFEQLVSNRIRRDHMLVAIGGGIVQDITCFVASTLFRGISWSFVPTTLLAQADSCIGSKSSINLGGTKNILGTFYPPRQVFIASRFLETLESRDVRSGVGEIVKVHAIDGVAAFDGLANDFDRLFVNDSVLQRYVRSALLIKKRFIEEDEFDRGIRNVFNYGHSFGHAIESATQYEVPHGIAVGLGMDLANSLAVKLDLLPAEHHCRMHALLRKLYGEYAKVSISPDDVLSALFKDKKNTRATLGLILPVGSAANIERVAVAPDATFDACFRDVFAEVFG
jgi:3-dehydroquinate synthase